jgi:uncharacterized membrane protein YkvA (DUF1232 family)
VSASIEGTPVRGTPVRRRRARAGGASGHDQQHDEEGVRGSPRVGAKRTVMATIRQIPHYLKLLFGLVRDSRVSVVDKLLVAGAIAYVLSPIDLLPDFIPFLGQVDDIFLVLTALQRLISNAGRHVLLDHWEGAREDLHDLNIGRVISASAFFLPPAMRRRLRRLAHR